MSKAKHDPNHDTNKEKHTCRTEITYPSTTRTFTSNDAFLNHQRATAIRMGVASFLGLRTAIRQRCRRSFDVGNRYGNVAPIAGRA